MHCKQGKQNQIGWSDGHTAGRETANPSTERVICGLAVMFRLAGNEKGWVNGRLWGAGRPASSLINL